jgi:hypothetical protein
MVMVMVMMPVPFCPRARARTDDGHTVHEKVLEDRGPAVRVRHRLVAVQLVSRRASFVGRFGSIVLVVGLLSVSVFVAVLVLVPPAQFETCAKAAGDARKTGALLTGAGAYKW